MGSDFKDILDLEIEKLNQLDVKGLENKKKENRKGGSYVEDKFKRIIAYPNFKK